jgi:hypothetical protein
LKRQSHWLTSRRRKQISHDYGRPLTAQIIAEVGSASKTHYGRIAGTHVTQRIKVVSRQMRSIGSLRRGQPQSGFHITKVAAISRIEF